MPRSFSVSEKDRSLKGNTVFLDNEIVREIRVILLFAKNYSGKFSKNIQQQITLWKNYIFS